MGTFWRPSRRVPLDPAGHSGKCGQNLDGNTVSGGFPLLIGIIRENQELGLFQIFRELWFDNELPRSRI